MYTYRNAKSIISLYVYSTYKYLLIESEIDYTKY